MLDVQYQPSFVREKKFTVDLLFDEIIDCLNFILLEYKIISLICMSNNLSFQNVPYFVLFSISENNCLLIKLKMKLLSLFTLIAAIMGLFIAPSMIEAHRRPYGNSHYHAGNGNQYRSGQGDVSNPPPRYYGLRRIHMH